MESCEMSATFLELYSYFEIFYIFRVKSSQKLVKVVRDFLTLTVIS